MKASDLPALPPARVYTPIPQGEIDRINNLYAGMRRGAKQLLKDAMEIGDWFKKVRRDLPRDKKWYEWVLENFPKMSISTVYAFQKVASEREFVMSTMRTDDLCSVREALSLIRAKDRTPKPRIRAVVVRADAEPIVLLEAKLKNYVIQLYLIRYLEVEVKGMLEAMELTPDQLLRVLRYVCKDHPEVEEEVIRVFRPKLKVLPKDA
jgi:hypothetical protein